MDADYIIRILLEAKDNLSGILVRAMERARASLGKMDADMHRTRRTSQQMSKELGSAAKQFDELGAQANQATTALYRTQTSLRGLVFVLGLILISPLITGLMSLVTSLGAVASSAGLAAAALGTGLVGAIGAALPSLALMTATLARFAAVTKLVVQAEQLRMQQQANAVDLQDRQTKSAQALVKAYESLRDAQEGLTITRRDAVRRLEDLNTAQERARINAERTTLTLLEADIQARRSIRRGDVMGTLRANIDRESGNLDQGDAQKTLRRSTEDLNMAQQKGIEGSREMIAARRGLRDATYGLIEAEKEFGKALRGEDSSTRMLAYQLSQLSTQERRLFESLTNLRETYKNAFRPITDELTGAIADSVDKISGLLKDNRVLGPFRELARSGADAIRSVVGGATSGESIKLWGSITKMAASELPRLVAGFNSFMLGFTRLAAASKPILDYVTAKFMSWGKMFEDWTSDRVGLDKFINRTLSNLKSWVGLVEAGLKIIRDLGNVGASSGQSIVDSLTKKLEEADRWIKNNEESVKKFFQDAQRVTEEAGRVLLELGRQLLRIFDSKNAEEFGIFLRQTLLPALGDFVLAMGRVNQLIFRILDSPVIGTLAQWTLSIVLIGLSIKSLSNLIIGLGQAIRGNLVLTIVAVAIFALIKLEERFQLINDLVPTLQMGFENFRRMIDDWAFSLADAARSIGNAFASLPDAIRGAFADMLAYVAGIPGYMFQVGNSIVDNIVGGISNLGSRILDTFAIPFRAIYEMVASAWNTLAQNIPTLPGAGIPNIPLIPARAPFAAGGVVPGPRGAGDVIPAWLSPNEVVLNETQQAMVGKDAIYSVLRATGAPMGLAPGGAYRTGAGATHSSNERFRMRVDHLPGRDQTLPGTAEDPQERNRAKWERVKHLLYYFTSKGPKYTADMLEHDQDILEDARTSKYDYAVTQPQFLRIANAMLRKYARWANKHPGDKDPTPTSKGQGKSGKPKPGEAVPTPLAPYGGYGGAGGNDSFTGLTNVAPNVVAFYQQLVAATPGDQYVLSGFRPGSTVLGTGRVSLHASGHAVDIASRDMQNSGLPSVISPQLDALAVMARQALGQGSQIAGTTSNDKGEVLWRTMQGGNHYNHVHVGLKGDVSPAVTGSPALGTYGAYPGMGPIVGGTDPTTVTKTRPETFKEFVKRTTGIEKFQRLGPGRYSVAPKYRKSAWLLPFAEEIFPQRRGTKSYSVTKPGTPGSPATLTGMDIPGGGTGGDPSSNKQLGMALAQQLYGWSGAEWTALEDLWTRESGWNHLAENPSSHAYGIAQALPASKYNSAGADWKTNPRTQILWGLKYIHDRYGSPTGAIAWHNSHNWYASGGLIPGEGRPVPIVAHGGEMVLNKGQQNMLGGRKRLMDMFGFSPRTGKFARGGLVGEGRFKAEDARTTRFTSGFTPDGAGGGIPTQDYELLDERSASIFDIGRYTRALKKLRPTIDKFGFWFQEFVAKTSAAAEDLSNSLQTKLQQISRKFTQARIGSGKEAFTSESVQGVQASLQELNEAQAQILGDRGRLQGSLRAANEAFAKAKNANQRRAASALILQLQGLLDKNEDERLSNIQSQIETQKRLITARTAAVDRSAQFGSSAADRTGRLGRLFANPALVQQSIRDQQNVASTQIANLTTIMNDAFAQGNVEAGQDLQDRIAELQTKVQELGADLIQSQISAVEDSSNRKIRSSEIRARIADLRSANGTDFAARARELGIQGSTLRDERANLQSLLAGATGQAAVDLQAKIEELDLQIEENTAAVKDNTKSQFDFNVQQAAKGFGFRLGGNDIKSRIAALSGPLFGPDKEALLGLAGERGGILGEQRTSLQGLLEQAKAIPNNTDAVNDLTNQLLENELAILENNKNIAELNGSLGTPQSFASTPWQMFRQAIFNGAGFLLPQFQVPHLAGGGTILESGIAVVHKGETVVPAGEGGGLSVTINEAGGPVDVVGLASTLSYLMKVRN